MKSDIHNLVSYIDPGSGGILLYVITGFLIGSWYSIKKFFIKALHIFPYLKNYKANSQELAADIILHVEGPQYEAIFYPIAKELSQKGCSVLYVTQYARDEKFPKLPDNIDHQEILPGWSGFVALNRAEAKIMVTTTPQLDVYMFKRSPKVNHYINILHAPTDTGTLEMYALDFFNTVFCPGEFMFKEIRHLEKLRNLPAKNLKATGVAYYDTFKKNQSQFKSEPSKKKPTLLIAPSWGRNCLFNNIPIDFVDKLKSEFDIIIRPHPQTKVSQEQLYAKIQKYCNENNIELDEASDPSKSMTLSDIMLSDFSGIVYDYAFLYEKPQVVCNMNIIREGFEGYYLDKPLWREKILPEIATVINIDEIEKLPDAIKLAYESPKKEIAKLRDKYIANFANATPIMACEIVKILAA